MVHVPVVHKYAYVATYTCTWHVHMKLHICEASWCVHTYMSNVIPGKVCTCTKIIYAWYMYVCTTYMYVKKYVHTCTVLHTVHDIHTVHTVHTNVVYMYVYMYSKTCTNRTCTCYIKYIYIYTTVSPPPSWLYCCSS